ncbi:MAG: alpha-N-arabinofuranosidase, partial [Pseudorhodobacter sp.]|nr:alpha-N-arabinofuranosidase [Pseudorhodobacter sp.]
LQGFGAATVIDHQEMTHTMLEAVNTATDQTNVAPKKVTGATVKDGTLSLSMKPLSYAMIRVKLG